MRTICPRCRATAKLEKVTCTKEEVYNSTLYEAGDSFYQCQVCKGVMTPDQMTDALFNAVEFLQNEH